MKKTITVPVSESIIDSTPVDIDHYVAQYRMCLKKTAHAILELALLLKNAEDNLSKTQFIVFREKISADETKDSYIKKLLCIAKKYSRLHFIAEKLPPSFTTLYTLSQLDDKAFTQLCDAKKIKPNMTLKDLAEYLNRKPRNADHLFTLNLKKLSNANKASFIIEIEKLCQLYKIELNSTISRSKSQKTSASSEIVFDEFEDVKYSEIETV
jgi:hypothetical protein